MSDVYAKIDKIIRDYMVATQISPEKPYDPSLVSAIASYRHPDAVHSWRPNYFVANNPQMPKGKVDNEAWIKNATMALPQMEKLETKIHDIIIDAKALKATVLVSLFVTPKGLDFTMESDEVFVYTFKEVEGGELKIVESVEYIDGAASEGLIEKFTKAAGKK